MIQSARRSFIFITTFCVFFASLLMAEDGGRGDIPGAGEMIDARTDDAIKRGLDALAKIQRGDGSFGTGSYQGNVAISALGGLAFMASGSSPGRGPYGSNVEKVVKYILDNTSEGGLVAADNSSQVMYGHGFATLFLAEVYGMTHDKRIADKLRKAVRLIIDTQNKEGGWRYQPRKADADMSVTICQINALRAARNSGLFVPKETVDLTLDYVKKSQNPNGSFRYMLAGGGGSTVPLTAAGLVALFSVGDYASDSVRRALEHLRATPFKAPQPHYYYGLYYIVQARWIYGGDVWNEWYPSIRDELLALQDKASGLWSGDFVGRDYSTAMALLVLQTPNNFLPIFQR